MKSLAQIQRENARASAWSTPPRASRRCKHENVDHYQVICNGVLQSQWLRCLDCAAISLKTNPGRERFVKP